MSQETQLKDDNYRTPPDLLAALNHEFRFDLYDPCAENTNDPRTLDGLGETPNNINTYFMNPPYSDVTPWLQKARHDQARGKTVVCLLKRDDSTAWYRDNVMGYAEERPIIGRLKFDGKHSANFASYVAIFRGLQHTPTLGTTPRTVYLTQVAAP
jgi:DNA N-6-adenine-methyltransferase Dam